MDQNEDLESALAGRYEIEREVGRGGMAVVYLARDIKHSRSVALKVLRQELTTSLGPERFLREISITASLAHQNILPLYDSGEAAGHLYYVMPYVEGSTLGQRLKREVQLPLDDVLAIARQVAAALDYAHSNGVIHRDIKPDNILLLGDHVLVGDFGLARAISNAASTPLTDSAFVVGTIQYMSPEQCTPGRALDGRSDIYSLGCVVFEMITGVPPFRGATPGATMTHHLMSDPPSLRDERRSCPSTVDDVVRRALAKAPADRFRTAGEFVRALESPEPVPVVPVTPRSSFFARLGVRAGNRLRSLGYATFGVAAIAAVTVTLTVANQPPSGNSGIPDGDLQRVAVLYFDDLTSDNSLRHIAAGLTENLIDQLSQVRQLRVVSPNGVRAFRDTEVPLDSIARRLHAGTIIAGSVSSSGSQLRVAVRMIDANTGDQISNRILQRPMLGFFALQDTLTTDVAYWLREHLGRQIRLRHQRAGTASVAAWELAQRGQELTRQGTSLVQKGDARALDLFRRADSALASAEELDPKWTVATAGRARTAISEAFAYTDVRGEPTPAFAARLRKAIHHADRALARTPELADALAVRGEARARLVTFANAQPEDSLLAIAESDLRRATTARPDMARAWYVLGEIRFHQARFVDAAEALTTAYDVDPFLDNIRTVLQSLFFSSLYAGDSVRAREWCRLGRTRFPEDPTLTPCDLYVLGAFGKTGAAAAKGWQLVRDIERDDSAGFHEVTWSFRRMMVAAILARARMTDSARAVIARTSRDRGQKPAADKEEAYVRLLLGDREGALDLLARSLAVAPYERAWVAKLPWYGELHQHPRFQKLISVR